MLVVFCVRGVFGGCFRFVLKFRFLLMYFDHFLVKTRTTWRAERPKIKIMFFFTFFSQENTEI